MTVVAHWTKLKCANCERETVTGLCGCENASPVSVEERMCADAAVAWRDATETVSLHASRAVVADAMEVVLDRLRASERAAHKDDRRPTLQEQYGALIAGFEDVLKEMGDG